MIYMWQYSGLGSWDEIIHWCFENLSDGTYASNGYETIVFYSETDYLAFLLRWA